MPEQRLLVDVARAFGGLSQVADEDLGRALAGHVRNQGWDESAVEHHAEVLAALMSEEFPESPPASRERIAAAARRSLEETEQQRNARAARIEFYRRQRR